MYVVILRNTDRTVIQGANSPFIVADGVESLVRFDSRVEWL